MTDTIDITIGTDKQIAYAQDIFARKGDFIREQNAKFATQFQTLVDDLKGHIGDTIPNTNVAVSQDMIDRAERMVRDFSGGAEHYAVFWIEDVPQRETFDTYVMTGKASEKMLRMGLGA